VYTNRDARQYVMQAIEANGQDVASAWDFDVDAIVDDLYGLAGGWDFSVLDAGAFWRVVGAHAYGQQS